MPRLVCILWPFISVAPTRYFVNDLVVRVPHFAQIVINHLTYEKYQRNHPNSRQMAHHIAHLLDKAGFGNCVKGVFQYDVQCLMVALSVLKKRVGITLNGDLH